MRFTLIKNVEKNPKHWIPDYDEEKAETYRFNVYDNDEFCKDFCYGYEVDKGTIQTLDYGDVEFFNAKHCKRLKKNIEERLKHPAKPRIKELYLVLLDYVSRAAELNTGVIIEF